MKAECFPVARSHYVWNDHNIDCMYCNHTSTASIENTLRKCGSTISLYLCMCSDCNSHHHSFHRNTTELESKMKKNRKKIFPSGRQHRQISRITILVSEDLHCIIKLYWLNFLKELIGAWDVLIFKVIHQ
jgi:hypothetical protein